MHIHNTLIKLSCVCISTHMQLLCLSVAQGTVNLVSLVSNWQVGLVILQILSGENHLNDVIVMNSGFDNNCFELHLPPVERFEPS